MFLWSYRFGLACLDASHFAAHERPIALIEVRDLQHSAIAKVARSISQKQVSQVTSALEIEIHRQKREVVGDVDEAESVVELDAIKDGGRLRAKMDVIEMQIAVAIEDPMLLNAFKEQFLVRDVELVREMLDRFESNR